MARAWLVGSLLLLASGVAWSFGTARAQDETNGLRATVAAQATAVVQLRTRVYALELRADRAEERLGWIADDLAELPRSRGGAIIWGAVLGGGDVSAAGGAITLSPTPEGGLFWTTLVDPPLRCNIYRNPQQQPGMRDYLLSCY